jgi:hypothetical protein
MNHPAAESRQARPNTVRLQLIDGNQIVNAAAGATAKRLTSPDLN